MINDDLYEDEVMRDVWERKAHVSARYGDWEEYRQKATDDQIYSSGNPVSPPRRGLSLPPVS